MNRAINLGDINTAAIRNMLGNRCFTKAIVATGSNTAKVKTTTNTVQYCIDGILYEKAATDDLFVFTDTKAQPDLTTAFYAFCLDKDGASVVVNGTPVLTAAITAGTDKAFIPAIPDTACLIGAVKVVASGGAFTPGTSGVATAGNFTVTFYNLTCTPAAGYP